MQEFSLSVDTLNEFECVITMPKEMVASIVAQYLQRITQWGGMHANIQCTIASYSKIKSIVSDRENDQGETEQGTIAAPQVSAEPQLEEMMNRMMVGIITKVNEKLKSISDKSLPRVSNQSFATDKVIPSLEISPVIKSKFFWGEGIT